MAKGCSICNLVLSWEAISRRLLTIAYCKSGGCLFHSRTYDVAVSWPAQCIAGLKVLMLVSDSEVLQISETGVGERHVYEKKKYENMNKMFLYITLKMIDRVFWTSYQVTPLVFHTTGGPPDVDGILNPKKPILNLLMMDSMAVFCFSLEFQQPSEERKWYDFFSWRLYMISFFSVVFSCTHWDPNIATAISVLHCRHKMCAKVSSIETADIQKSIVKSLQALGNEMKLLMGINHLNCFFSRK